jgi:hypothetical protein
LNAERHRHATLLRGLRLAAIAGAVLAAAIAPAWSSPFEVGDADTGSGLKLQAHAAYARSDAGVAWTRPALNAGWGFAETFEITFGVGYGIDEPHAGHPQQGRQDASLALKWRLRDEDEDGQGVAWAIEPAVSLPTGDREAGMGGEELQLALPLRVSNRIGRSRIIGQLGYSRALETGRSTLGIAALYEYRVAPDWVLGLEVLHDGSPDRDTDDHLRANAGLRWEAPRGWQLFGSLGRSRATAGEPAQTMVRAGIEYAFE